MVRFATVGRMPPEQLGEPTITRHLGAADALNVQRLLSTAEREDGFRPLSDQLAADLDDLERSEAETVVTLAPIDDNLAGFGVASRRTGEWTFQIVTDPAHRDPSLTVLLLTTTLAAVRDAGGGRVDWWVFGADGRATAQAATAGLHPDRELLLMRRALPAARRSTVATRGFRPTDEEAWLAVNNRAFAGHHEQGRWTLDTLHQRMRQPWFDPDGLRLHERDGRIAAFCWTKIHRSGPDSPAGEIYVIGVDPDFQGLGLGKELTLAGLDHIVDRGMPRALLYVAGENSTAKSLYEHLGFTVHRTDRAYVGFVG